MTQQVIEIQGVDAVAIADEKALAKLEQDEMLSMVKEQDKAMFRAMAGAQSLDWKSLTPNLMAVILTAKPYKVSGGGTTFLTYKQALIFALRAYEMGVSPLSSEVFFNMETGQTSLTLEGLKKVARNMGLDLGPPQFTEMAREFSEIPRTGPIVEDLKRAGFTKDLAVTCKIRVGKPELKEHAEYTAYLSEWYVSRSPVWQAKPIHMIQTRSYARCLNLAMGTGASDMVD